MANKEESHTECAKEDIVDLKRWMKAIEGYKRVSELVIPGTHDSATGNSSVLDITGLFKTQRLNISEQLHIGVRFLDIRTKLYHNDLILVHGIVDLGMSLSELSCVVKGSYKKTLQNSFS